MRFKVVKLVLILSVIMGLAGCTFIFQKGRRSDVRKIEELSQQLDELSQTKNLLEERLAQEIQDKQVQLKMMEKGLVITFMADVLFDSGKTKIKSEAFGSLDKVANVLQENVPDLKVGIEGYTDNEPIKYSGWRSNWELSTARALSVLHYLIDTKNIAGQRLSVLGYAEFQPVASNDTKEGRQLNRRVEIVIIPATRKVKKDTPEVRPSKESKENLK